MQLQIFLNLSLMKKIYSIGAILVVGIMTLTATSAFAATQTNTLRGSEDRVARMEEMKVSHEAIQKATLDGDYATWSKLVAEMPMGDERLKVITADNFAEFSRAHKLMAEADTILKGLGIEKGPGKGEFGKGRGGMHRGMMEK